ncbi:6-phosphogluconolactonase [Candidatus Peregrinibacteria bacterium]|nr:6-phosphogluconolactonase [Candidatus Peregrinibacteria bacterium]
MNYFTFASEQDWHIAAVQEILKDVPRDTEFSLALSGGSTPIPVYEELAKQNIPWGNAHIFEVDERYILPEKPDSNALLIHNHFLNLLPEPPKSVYFFETSGVFSWKESAEKYHDLLQKFEKPFDVCILGIGPDGHTASLFPNGPEIHETEKLATISETNIFPVWKRLTVTFPMILKSKKIVVLLCGISKRKILDELEHGEKSWEEFPAKKILSHPNLHIFFCEEE